jgi:minor histocompatibility antigen H13
LQETKKLEKPEPEEDNEQMTNKDAAMLPVYLSGYLFGIYLLFKLLDKAIISALITGFFSMIGVTSVSFLFRFFA